jgi:4-amino-4-deoxy-L-arabinose transferase-like glycosyltransferase
LSVEKSPLPKLSPFNTNHLWFFLFLFLGIVSLFFASWDRPLANPDEARYTQIPLHMIQTSDFITPRLNGVKYFEKPPLMYWIQAIQLWLFGLNEAMLRIGVKLFALMGMGLVYWWAKRQYNQLIAVMASTIMISNILYCAIGQIIILDMPLSFFMTASLFFFYEAMYQTTPIKRRWYFGIFCIMCGLGVLTKGLIALAIPGPIIVIWLTLTKQWNKIRPFFPISNGAIFLAIVVPWHILVQQKNPEFFHKYFVIEHIIRYTTKYHARFQPYWFFILIFFVGFLPWFLLLPASLPKLIHWIKQGKKKFSQHPDITFLLLWAGWVFIFFSWSHSKLIPYIVPMIAPMSLLLAKWAYHYQIPIVYGRIVGYVLMALGTLPWMVLRFVPDGAIISQKINNGIWIISSAFFVSGVVIQYIYWKKNKNSSAQNHQRCLHHRLLKCFAILGIIITGTIQLYAPNIQKPSTKKIALYIKNHKDAKDKIVCFDTYFQDLPVYAQQTVAVVEGFGELSFGTTVEDTRSWMIDRQTFMNWWSQKIPMWIVARTNNFEKLIHQYPTLKYIKIKEDGPFVLIKNQ